MSDAEISPASAPEPAVDDLFEALSDGRRRSVLSHLHRLGDDVVELSELVDGMLAREAERTDDGREEVAIALHHVHLPKLADCGLLDYDARSRTVRYGRHPNREERVALALEVTRDLS